MVTTNAPIITLRDVRFTYDGGATWALDGVSLDIRRGERICLTGPNGSGKSTLSRVIAGLVAPDEGYVALSGNVVFDESGAHADEYRTARCGIGAVFQHPEDQIVTTVTEDDVAFGPAAAVIVSVLGFVPHLFTNPWGTLMAVLVALALSVPASLIYKKNKTRKGALIGIIVGAVVALAVAIVGNIIVTPFYAHMTTAQVVALIVPALLPFNALKFTIHGVVTFLIYKPISNLLNR